VAFLGWLAPVADIVPFICVGRDFLNQGSAHYAFTVGLSEVLPTIRQKAILNLVNCAHSQ
jgi:hypothetical protein